MGPHRSIETGLEGIVAVVLVGGKGTRLRPLTYSLPKALIRVEGKPFIDHLLAKIAKSGIKQVLLLTGYKSEMIESYCRSGKKWGLQIAYSKERRPLKTGGALVNAKNLIKKTALVLNGDSYLDLDLKKFFKFHKKRKAYATVYAMSGSLRERGSIEAGKDGLVKEFLEKQKGGRGIFNTGVFIIEPKALGVLKKEQEKRRLGTSFSMEKEGFVLFIKKRKMFSFLGRGRFIDIGTFNSLSKAGRVIEGKAKAHKGAIFLDRDGVINKNRDTYVTRPEQFIFEKNAIAGLKKLAKTGLPISVVTNQSIIGRGILNHSMLMRIHKKMLEGFSKNGIFIHGIFFCPHKPHDGCGCRKPKIGMLLEAKKKFGVDLGGSFVIGDASGDILMGNAAGCTTILVKTGYAGKDNRHLSKPDYVAKDLIEAANIIEKIIERGRENGKKYAT